MGKSPIGRKQLKFYFKRTEIEILERVCAHFKFKTKAIVTKTALRLIFQAMTDTDAIDGDVLTIVKKRAV